MCQACIDFSANHQTGSFNAKCRECDARHLAITPVYDEARRLDRLTENYKWALKNAAGDDWKELHERVKHYARLIRGVTA